jgi:hypothetical protein
VDEKPALGFIALKSLKQGAPDPAAAIDEIRRIYFKTTKQTIDADMAHAIELLKTIADEEVREKAVVFMHGLSEMQREWRGKRPKKVEKLKGDSGGRVSGRGRGRRK